MKFHKCIKESFVVIGKEGSTKDGEGFSQGLYLAGVECEATAVAPEGWTKWIIPGFEYVYVECEDGDTFPKTLNYLTENKLTLVGAVHDFTCPESGKNYMFFPIRKL